MEKMTSKKREEKYIRQMQRIKKSIKTLYIQIVYNYTAIPPAKIYTLTKAGRGSDHGHVTRWNMYLKCILKISVEASIVDKSVVNCLKCIPSLRICKLCHPLMQFLLT